MAYVSKLWELYDGGKNRFFKGNIFCASSNGNTGFLDPETIAAEFFFPAFWLTLSLSFPSQNIICLFCFWQCFLVQGSISLAYQVSNTSLCRARAQVSCAHLLKIRRKIRSKIRRKVSESGSGVSTPRQLAAISTSCVHCRCVWVLLIALLCIWVGGWVLTA